MDYNNKFKHFYFGPCLAEFEIDNELCTGLLEKGKKLKEDARKDLAGHIDKEFNYTETDRNWFLSKFLGIINDYMVFLNTEFKPDNKKTNLRLDSLWINYMKKGEFNPPHVHSCALSFVIYLQVPDKLKLENKSYQGTDNVGPGGIKFINAVNNDHLNVSEVSIFPEKNKCYIFPATLLHMVYPFKSEGERISVSGNFEFIDNV